MIQEQAVVVSVNQGVASLEILRNKPCGLCGQTRGCGISIWGRLFGHRANIFKVRNTVNAKVDDIVVVGIEENALLLSAIIVYGVPLATLILGAAFANLAFADSLHADRNTVLGALFGLLIGYLWLKGHSQAGQVGVRYQPVILKVVDQKLVQMKCHSKAKK
jgi:sigma-E factor negative regulatory protein RseC